MLTLAEELYLLALNDEKGTVIGSASLALPYGLAGALVMELLLLDKLKMDGKNLIVTDKKKTGNDLLDEALDSIKQSNKIRTCQYWVNKLPSAVKDLKKRILADLVKKRILREEEQRVLWVFPTHRYPTKNGLPERELRERIRNVVLKKKEPDLRTSFIINLMKACGLIPEVFDKDERKMAKQRIGEITVNDPVGKGIEDSVTAIQAAIFTAVTASITASMIVNT